MKKVTVEEMNENYNETIGQCKDKGLSGIAYIELLLNTSYLNGIKRGQKLTTDEATAILPDVSGWVSVSDKTKPMPNDRKMQIKFKEGTIMDYDAENWPWDIVTHWRPKP